jgi:hypothetical protein
VTRDLVATSTNRALIDVTSCQNCGGGGPQGPTDFGLSGQPVSRTFYLSNVGAVPTTALSVGGLSGAFSLGTNTCGAALAPQASCTVEVLFTPSGNGVSTGTLSVSAADASGALPPVTRDLTATSTSRALLQLSDCFNCGGGGPGMQQPYDFGITGVAKSQAFQVRNVGAQSATLGTATVSSPFSATGCTGSLAAGASCTLTVTFTPSGNQTSSATVTLTATDGGGVIAPVTRALTGTSTNRALLIITDGGGGGGPPGPYDFGTWGISTRHTFQVNNVGGGTATSLAFAIPASTLSVTTVGSFSPCGSSLAVNAQCTLDVTFTPSGNGVTDQSLTVTYSDGTPQSVARALTAQSTTAPLLVISDYGGVYQPGQGFNPGPFLFGTWGVSNTWTFTVFNIGGAAAVNLGGAALSAPFSFTGGFPGLGGDCGTSLANGPTPCRVAVTFTPPASVGSFSGQLRLNFGSGQSVSRDFSASSTDRALLMLYDNGGGCGEQCGPLDFGTVSSPGTTTRQVMLENRGAIAATAPVFSGLAPPFSISMNGCTGPLVAGPQCQVTITFAPAGTGVFPATLNVSSSDAVGALPGLMRSLRGTGN